MRNQGIKLHVFVSHLGRATALHAIMIVVLFRQPGGWADKSDDGTGATPRQAETLSFLSIKSRAYPTRALDVLRVGTERYIMPMASGDTYGFVGRTILTARHFVRTKTDL